MKNDLCDRLRQLRKELNLTQEAVSLELGIGKSALSMIETGKATLSERNKNTLARCYNLNLTWLEKGTGPMFAATPPAGTESGEIPAAIQASLKQSVPLFNPSRMDDLQELFSAPAAATAEEHIYIPGLPHCDGAVRVTDDGMYPLLRRGDIILYKPVRDHTDSLLWEDLYLILVETGGEERLMVRTLRPSGQTGYVTITNSRPGEPGMEIPLSKIRALALVKASIRLHSTK